MNNKYCNYFNKFIVIFNYWKHGIFLFIFCSSIFCYTYFNKNLFYGSIVLLTIILLLTVFFLILNKNKIFYLIYSIKNEIKKIVWPDKNDTFYITIIVVFITIIMSLILWILDNLSYNLISYILKMRI
ncbi:Protein translocase subunit SecE [Buchnera aphidicola (Thelaxes suberi)]|uniref:preprotein translocase subunit SecE n=1 Tax=Buchnera aphidicola TaxID=9 RepID=UPI003463B4F9